MGRYLREGRWRSCPAGTERGASRFKPVEVNPSLCWASQWVRFFPLQVWPPDIQFQEISLTIRGGLPIKRKRDFSSQRSSVLGRDGILHVVTTSCTFSCHIVQNTVVICILRLATYPFPVQDLFAKQERPKRQPVAASCAFQVERFGASVPWTSFCFP